MNGPLPVDDEPPPLPSREEPPPDVDAPLRRRARDYNYQEHAPAARIEDILKQFDDFRQSDPRLPQWSACCPAHNDSRPSLSIKIAADGRLLLHCHGGCTFDEIWRKLNAPPLTGYRWNTDELLDTVPSPVAARTAAEAPPAATSLAEVTARLQPGAWVNAPGSAEDWAELLAGLQANVNEEILDAVARDLGVDGWALRSLGIGRTELDRGVLVFPEFDGQGRIVGLTLRCDNGRKQAWRGSHRGLLLPIELFERPGPIFCCEGATDTAALLTMGLAAVGRPSALGGVQQLGDLLLLLPAEREVVVLGEMDSKSDGRWPGLDAAKKTAQTLSDQLGRNVSAALPPDEAKDVRVWLQQTRATHFPEIQP